MKEMAPEEMRDKIHEDYCDSRSCKDCPLDGDDSLDNPDHFCGYNQSAQKYWELIPRDYAILYGNNEADPVNNPSHYKVGNGVEVIDLTENLNFCRGNAVKYLCRAGKKDPAKELEDLKKAQWYVNREIQRMERSK